MPTYEIERSTVPQTRIDHEIPGHLKKYVVEQNYERYSPEDQAVWRFLMRQLKKFLTKNAHECYLEGLVKTGISVESIPRIEDVNAKLKTFGWGAVSVSGFIPPAAFMEFQARGFLPIASDMRTIDHILYTPAPDIVHEAAGHAPILVDPQFANYLKDYAEIAANAIISYQDLQQYRLIRKLSDLKEDPGANPDEISETERQLEEVSNSIKEVSEAGILGRMNWWTAEYGLIGSLENPKIFGAGLLSSLGEAQTCLKKDVEKVPFSIKCIDYSYDITEPQPQLFVTKDFDELTKVLHELADTMAFRKGGVYGLDKAIKAKTLNTVELDSGIQLSGQLIDYFCDSSDNPSFLKFKGPSQLSYGNRELQGHGKNYHSEGYSTPIGPIKGLNKCLSKCSEQDLNAAGISLNKKVQIEFESGVTVIGNVSDFLFKDEKLLLITFTNCHVSLGEKVLFLPEWGNFDMAIGSSIPSVFGGAADRVAYGEIEEDFEAARVPQKKYTARETRAHNIYLEIRKLRNSQESESKRLESLKRLIGNYCDEFTDQWLMGIELLEISYLIDADESLKAKLVANLEAMKVKLQNREYMVKCIEDGIRLAAEKY